MYHTADQPPRVHVEETLAGWLSTTLRARLPPPELVFVRVFVCVFSCGLRRHSFSEADVFRWFMIW